MKKNLSRIVLTIVLLVLAVYFIYPTYKDYQLNKELSKLTGQDSIAFVDANGQELKDAQLNRIKLGLDLKGGMYVVLDVDVVKLLGDLANRSDQQLTDILAEMKAQDLESDEPIVEVLKEKLQQKGLTLKSYYGDIRDEESDVESLLNSEIDGAIDRAVEVVRNRVDQYGVAEPQIQKIGGKRIIVELPGVSNPEDVRKLLQGTALLEFKLVYDPQKTIEVMQRINKVLAGTVTTDSTDVNNNIIPDSGLDSIKAPEDTVTSAGNKQTDKKEGNKQTTGKDTTKKTEKKTDTTKTKKDTSKDTSKKSSDSVTGNDLGLTTDTNLATDTSQQVTQEEFLKQNPLFFTIAYVDPQGSTADAYVLESDKPKVDRYLAREDVKAVMPPDMQFAWGQRTSTGENGEKIYSLIAIKKEAELTGKVITNAQSNIDPTSNSAVVNMEMSSEGAADWARITGANINKRCAIVLDNVVYSAPVIRSKITGGNSVIEGMSNIQEAKLLEIVLKAGALPAPLRIIEERSIGPSLGEDSIKAGVTSSIAALILVALFMIVYYRFGGTVADLALLINVLFILGIMASFKATLTLPGIAGLILSLGMAVDTNVLIFERIREELGTGKPMKTAIDIGYKKAFSAILDSHITSVITAIILYQFGTGPIQGFALTLLFGISANLFTAIVITHFIFDILVEKGKKISFG